MAGLISWLGGNLQKVEKQINPFDNGATFKNPNPPQPTTPQPSVLQQATHDVASIAPKVFNVATFGLGHAIAPVEQKIFQATPFKVQQTVQHLPAPLNTAGNFVNNSFVKPLATLGVHSAQLAQGQNPYHGTNEQIAGQLGNDALAAGSLLPIGKVSEAVTASRGLPLATRALQSARTGAKFGAGFGASQGLTNSLAQNQNLPQIALHTGIGGVTGGVFGGLTGGAVPVAGHGVGLAGKGAMTASRAAVKTAKAVDEKVLTPRASLRDQQTLRDFSDYLRLPTGKNDIAPDLSTPQKTFINDYAEMLQGMDGNGVTVMPDNTRSSANSPFYRNIYAETGRPPTKADWFNEARRQIESGNAAYGASDAYNALPSNGVLASPERPPRKVPTGKPTTPLQPPKSNAPDVAASSGSGIPGVGSGKVVPSNPTIAPEVQPTSGMTLGEYQDLAKAKAQAARDTQYAQIGLVKGTDGLYHKVGAPQPTQAAKTQVGKLANQEKPGLSQQLVTNQTPKEKILPQTKTNQTEVLGAGTGRSQTLPNNTTKAPLLPAPAQPTALLGAGKIELTPAQAKARFKALQKRGNTFEVSNPQKGSDVYTVTPGGTVKMGANAGTIKVLQRGSQNGIPIKVTPFNKPNYDFTKWRDRSALGLGRETLERNLDSVAGGDAAAAKKLLVDSSRQNEAARTQFANDLRNNTKEYVVKQLGIKPGSEDSALVQKYGEKLIDEGGLLRAVNGNEIRAAKIIEASQYFRKQYDQLIDDWNKVRAKYGFDPIPKRQDYFRHFQAIDQNASILGTIKNAKDLPTEISGITDIFNPTKPFSDAALQRKGNKTTFDAVGGFDNYINSVSRQIFHTDTVQKGRALETAIRTAAAADPKVNLPNFVANLHEWTNLVSGKKTRIDRAAEQLVGRKVYAAAEKLKQQTGANMIGANLGSALTNFVPFTQAAATTSKGALLKGIQEAALTPLSKNPNVIDGVASSFLTRRYAVDAIEHTKLQKVSAAASLPFRLVDEFTSRSIVAGKYYENVAKGMTKDEAMRSADDYAARVITDRSTGQLPNLINTKTAGALTQFQAEVNNQVSFLMKDIPQFANGNKAKVASSLTQFVVYSYLANQGYQALMGRRVQLDPLHAALTLANPHKTGSQKVSAVKQDVLGGLPFTSIFTGGRLPANAMFPNVGDVGKGVNDLRKGNTSQGSRELYSGLSGPIFYGLPPFGGGQVKKSLDAGLGFNKGYSETPTSNVRFPMTKTPGNVASGLLFGQYATSQGKQYIGKGQPQPLSNTESQNFKALPPNQRAPYFNSIQTDRQKTAANPGISNDVQKGIDNYVKTRQSKLLSGLYASSAYKSASPLDQKNMVNKTLSDLRSAAKIQMTNGDDSTASKNVKAILKSQGYTFKAPGTKTSSSSIQIAKNLPKQYSDVLNKYSSMSTADRTKAFSSLNDAEYQYNLAKYQNDLANGSLTTASKIRTQQSLAKDKVGATFPKDVRDLYGVSKNVLAQYLSTPEKGVNKQKLADQLLAYDQALYNAGVSSSLKFKNGIAPSSRSGSGSKFSPFAAQLKFNAATAAPKVLTFNGLPAVAPYKPPTITRKSVKTTPSNGNFKYSIHKGLI